MKFVFLFVAFLIQAAFACDPCKMQQFSKENGCVYIQKEDKAYCLLNHHDHHQCAEKACARFPNGTLWTPNEENHEDVEIFSTIWELSDSVLYNGKDNHHVSNISSDGSYGGQIDRTKYQNKAAICCIPDFTNVYENAILRKSFSKKVSRNVNKAMKDQCVNETSSVESVPAPIVVIKSKYDAAAGSSIYNMINGDSGNFFQIGIRNSDYYLVVHFATKVTLKEILISSIDHPKIRVFTSDQYLEDFDSLPGGDYQELFFPDYEPNAYNIGAIFDENYCVDYIIIYFDSTPDSINKLQININKNIDGASPKGEECRAPFQKVDGAGCLWMKRGERSLKESIEICHSEGSEMWEPKITFDADFAVVQSFVDMHLGEKEMLWFSAKKNNGEYVFPISKNIIETGGPDKSNYWFTQASFIHDCVVYVRKFDIYIQNIGSHVCNTPIDVVVTWILCKLSTN